MDTEAMSEAVEARTFEGRATSDLFEEVAVALGGITDGARVRWSGVSVVPLLRACHLAILPWRAEADNRRRAQIIEGLNAAAEDETGGTAASILLAVVGSSDAALGHEQGEVLRRIRAAAARAALEPEPEPENAQAQLAGSESTDAGMGQMLEFQAQRIVQLEAEKRQLMAEVERLRRVPPAPTQSPRLEEGVPPVTASALTSENLADGAALAARGQKQIAELKHLLQLSLAELDKNDGLPRRPAAAASTVP